MGLKNRFQQFANGEKPSLGFDPLANDEARLAHVRLADIELDPDQPRKDLGDLSELAASIREHGILQPLVLSPLTESRYRIIAGERRFSAAELAGLRVVPALIRTIEDHRRIGVQLVENLHRKDLSPFEEAASYERLNSQFNQTHEDIAKQVGKSRTQITELLSLNRIPLDLREKCRHADISRDKLFLIAKQETPEAMAQLIEEILSGATRAELRVKARKGPERNNNGDSPVRKSKRVFNTSHEAAVIVQSTSDELNPEQVIAALKEALEEAERVNVGMPT